MLQTPSKFILSTSFDWKFPTPCVRAKHQRQQSAKPDILFLWGLQFGRRDSSSNHYTNKGNGVMGLSATEQHVVEGKHIMGASDCQDGQTWSSAGLKYSGGVTSGRAWTVSRGRTIPDSHPHPLHIYHLGEMDTGNFTQEYCPVVLFCL